MEIGQSHNIDMNIALQKKNHDKKTNFILTLFCSENI